jgi:hypothetical protein
MVNLGSPQQEEARFACRGRCKATGRTRAWDSVSGISPYACDRQPEPAGCSSGWLKMLNYTFIHRVWLAS